MRKQLFLKLYLSWNPNYPKNRKDDTSEKCDFCGNEAPRTASLYTEYGHMLMCDICEKCADNLPTPKIKSLKDFYPFLITERKEFEEEAEQRRSQPNER